MNKILETNDDYIPKEELPLEVLRYVAGSTATILKVFAFGFAVSSISMIAEGNYVGGIEAVAYASGLYIISSMCMKWLENNVAAQEAAEEGIDD